MSHDADRRIIHDTIAALDPGAAAALMDHLPPVPWVDLATKTDLSELRVELRGEIQELRGEFQELRGEMQREFADVRREIHDLKVQIGALGPKIMVSSFGATATSIALMGGAVAIFG
jgi:hypothetical protein